MNENEIVLKVVLEDDLASKTVGELKQDFKDLNAQLEKTQVGTEAYTKTLQSLANVKGGIQDLKEQINALNPERQFQAIAKLGSTIASGFAAAQAATALFGSGSEDLQKTLVKVQAATALAMGIQGLTGFVKALETARLAMIAFSLANPFTAITLAVVGLVSVFRSMSREVVNGTKELDELNKAHEKYSEIIKESNRLLDNRITALQNLKGTELEILELQKQKIINNLSEAKSEMAIYEATTLNAKAKASVLMTAGTVNAALAQSQANDIAILESGLKSFRNNVEKIEADLQAAENKISTLNADKNKRQVAEIEKSEQERINLEKYHFSERYKVIQAQVQAEIDIFLKLQKAKNAALQSDQAGTDAIVDDLIEQNKKVEAILKQASSSKIDLINDEKSLALEALNARYQDEIFLTEKLGEDTTDITKKYEEDKHKIVKYYEKLSNEERMKLASQVIGIANDLAQGVNAIFEQQAEHQKNVAEKEHNYKIGLTQAGYDDKIKNLKKEIESAKEAGQDIKKLEEERKKLEEEKNIALIGLERKKDAELNELAKKAFKRNKAFQLAGAITAGAQAVVQSLANPPGVPYTIPFAVAAGAISALNIGKIIATKFDGDSGGDSPMFSAPNISSPQAQESSFQQRQSTGINRDENGDFTSFQNQQQKPIRAYVVETEMSEKQRTIKRIEDNINY